MMARALGDYRAKRDFGATPEPSGAGGEEPSAARRFVVQEHHASSLHWDLRLERDGVLVSWAIPKGIPQDPRRNHLAVHVEDHPLDYVDFEGRIPEGQYGAGTVTIWDRGTYVPHKFRAEEVIVTFAGERVEGKYALFQTRGKNWMIHRMDPPADPDREPIPERIKPMLACLGALPREEADYAYELKWDGVRAILYSEGGHVRAESRNGADITARYPELRALGRALGAGDVVLDGEIVAFGDDGRPSFELLQRRMHLASESAVRRVAREVPATYAIFDVLYLEGRQTLSLPYSERRELLEQLKLSGAHWRTPAVHRGEAGALLEATRERGLEGIVAKRLDSRYEPGRRSPAWIKVKNQREQELVIGGWTAGKGGRAKRFGSLLLGYHDLDPREAARRGEPQQLRYAGNVGSGFSELDLALLSERLTELRRDTSPFSGRQPAPGAIFVEPQLVAQVAFREWTKGRTLRAPVFKGLVDDADPAEVVVEEASFRPAGG